MTPLGSSMSSSPTDDQEELCRWIVVRISATISLHLRSTSTILSCVCVFLVVGGGGVVFGLWLKSAFASFSFIIDIPTSRAAAALLAGEYGFVSWSMPHIVDAVDIGKIDLVIGSPAAVFSNVPKDLSGIASKPPIP